MPHMSMDDKQGSKGEGSRGGAFPRSPVPLLPFFLVTIIFSYFVIGALYATQTPAWQVPDEPAHYNVIRQIAQTGALPVLEAGDYDQDYLAALTRDKFPAAMPLDRVQYQDYQPPLYYLLVTPVFLLSGGSLIVLRLASLALGAGVIIFAFLAVRELFPAQPWLAFTATGFIAFIPQHIAIMAGVNNDSLSELLIAVGLFLVLRSENLSREPAKRAFIRGRWPFPYKAWLFGLVLGLAFLTKVQAYVLAPVFAAYVFQRWRRLSPAERHGARCVRWGMIMFGWAALIGALYWGRNWFVCGPLDVVCGGRHNQVVVGQPTTLGWIAQYGAANLIQRFFQFTFQSFWGVFGWMGVFMDQRVYWALLIFSAALAAGAVSAARRWPALSEPERDGLVLLALSALVTLALYLYYNLGFVQHQGRYLFPALIPIGLAAAIGLRQWARWLAALLRRVPDVSRFTSYVEIVAPLVPLALMAALAVLALYRFILPQLR